MKSREKYLGIYSYPIIPSYRSAWYPSLWLEQRLVRISYEHLSTAVSIHGLQIPLFFAESPFPFMEGVLFSPKLGLIEVPVQVLGGKVLSKSVVYLRQTKQVAVLILKEELFIYLWEELVSYSCRRGELLDSLHLLLSMLFLPFHLLGGFSFS
mmetsp:Transcript_10869/g.11002  ORF Transcript_10869/g.11002 Transcript_10869/m.11002 type:complete len:153 (+) Transcript_10869:15-473(+)